MIYQPTMMTIGSAVAYLGVHLTAYCLALRHYAVFQREKGIFLLHFCSACLLPCATALLNLDGGWITAAVSFLFAAAAHGIYSLTFLELWALADGSYSYVVLREAESQPRATTPEIVSGLAATSDQKKNQRLTSVMRLGLVAERGGLVMLTPRGRIASAFLRSLQRIAKISEAG